MTQTLIPFRETRPKPTGLRQGAYYGWRLKRVLQPQPQPKPWPGSDFWGSLTTGEWRLIVVMAILCVGCAAVIVWPF